MRGTTNPSPLAGEGGDRIGRTPGEGEASRPTPIARARSLRHDMTDAEHALWRILRNRQFAGVKFRRQVPVGVRYNAHLVVEADGGQHCESAEDRVRDVWFARQGFRVLRFWNNDILKNPEGVDAVISATLQQDPLTPPLRGHSLPQGGRVISLGLDKT
jgi:very-short-patch-repair endonuclease